MNNKGESLVMKHSYVIADWVVNINFVEESDSFGPSLLPSFAPFEQKEDDVNHQHLFTLTVDNSIVPVPKDQRQRIRVFDTGNGDTVVDRLNDGGYQYVIRDIAGNDCALLITNAEFTDCRCAIVGNNNMLRFGLNNALMLVFAFAGSFHDTLLIHASLVRHEGYGYAFIAKSGTGKSTQVANWLRTIPNCDLMNDDNPIIRICDGKPIIYGSPWSGKTPCYRRTSAPLGAVTRIDRAPENFVEQMKPIEAFGSFLPSCSAMKWEKSIYSRICDTVTAVITNTPIYTLHCTAEPESAKVCCKGIKHEHE